MTASCLRSQFLHVSFVRLFNKTGTLEMAFRMRGKWRTVPKLEGSLHLFLLKALFAMSVHGPGLESGGVGGGGPQDFSCRDPSLKNAF